MTKISILNVSQSASIKRSCSTRCGSKKISIFSPMSSRALTSKMSTGPDSQHVASMPKQAQNSFTEYVDFDQIETFETIR